MRVKFFHKIYAVILNKEVENELKKYFGENEIEKIMIKTKTGYEEMMGNYSKIDKEIYGILCINTYFISLYANIEKEIPHKTFVIMHENIIKGCRVLRLKKLIAETLNKIYKMNNRGDRVKNNVKRANCT